MVPLSRRSLSCGRLSSRLSTARESCDKASTGTASSLAMAFNPCVIWLISRTRLSGFVPALGRMSWR